MIDALIERVRAYASGEIPSLSNARVVLAVSGGADSSAMAALLVEAGIVDRRRTTAAHFDHRLRDGAAAAADRSSVAALCARYDMALVEGVWDSPRPGESAAREARYAFLRSVARAAGATVIVAGHTADDQAETVLMHMLRGAGLYGLRGMTPEAPCHGARELTIARPLLCATREETRAACRTLGIAFHDDETNADRRYLRNRVRLDVMPALAKAVPSPRDVLVRLAGDARASIVALEMVAGPLAQQREDAVILPRDPLRALPPEVAGVALRLALVRLLGDAREFDRRHYAVLARAADAKTGSKFKLARNVVVTVDPHELVLTVGDPRAYAIDPSRTYPLPFHGVVGRWRLDVVSAAGGAQAGRMPAALRLPAGAVVRARRPGDRLRPVGMDGTKKLQDYYVDRKVPRRLRDAAPVIAVGADVLWTPFGRGEPGPGSPFVIEAREVRSSA